MKRILDIQNCNHFGALQFWLLALFSILCWIFHHLLPSPILCNSPRSRACDVLSLFTLIHLQENQRRDITWCIYVDFDKYIIMCAQRFNDQQMETTTDYSHVQLLGGTRAAEALLSLQIASMSDQCDCSPASPFVWGILWAKSFLPTYIVI